MVAQPLTDEKIHWIKLKEILAHFQNGRVTITFQDGLPILIEDIEGRDKQINLTKEN